MGGEGGNLVEKECSRWDERKVRTAQQHGNEDCVTDEGAQHAVWILMVVKAHKHARWQGDQPATSTRYATNAAAVAEISATGR